MEYDFIYHKESRRYGLRLAPEHLALQCFLLDEFARTAAAFESLVQQLQQLTQHSEFQFDGKEYRLTVLKSEVVISHFTLLQDTDQPTDLDPEQDLNLDQSQLYAECGLEDLLHLIRQWQQFLPG